MSACSLLAAEQAGELSLDGVPRDRGALVAPRLHRPQAQFAHQVSDQPDAALRPGSIYGVAPWRSETFKFSTDPQLEAKIRDVVGLYLNPPDKAIVLCVDESGRAGARHHSK